MINRKVVKLGGSSNPSFPLESCGTSEQKSVTVPGVCFPFCKRYPPRGILIKFRKCSAQQLTQSKHLEIVRFTPGLIRPLLSPSGEEEAPEKGVGELRGTGVAGGRECVAAGGMEPCWAALKQDSGWAFAWRDEQLHTVPISHSLKPQVLFHSTFFEY